SLHAARPIVPTAASATKATRRTRARAVSVAPPLLVRADPSIPAESRHSRGTVDPMAARAPSPRTRVEHDTMGAVRVPVSAKWGAQTQRAVENFAISGVPVALPVVHALARIKGAVAAENARRRRLPRPVAAAIRTAA